MRTYLILAVAIVLLLVFFRAAEADGCVVRQRSAAVKKVVAETLLVPAAVAVAVPAYGASYQAPAVDQNTEILKALKALNERLDRLEKGQSVITPNNKPALEVKPATLPAVFAGKCAACHTEGQQAKGGGFILLKRDGSLAIPDARQWGLTATRTYLGEMPPKGGNPCTDEEVAEIQEFVRQQLRK